MLGENECLDACGDHGIVLLRNYDQTVGDVEDDGTGEDLDSDTGIALEFDFYK